MVAIRLNPTIIMDKISKDDRSMVSKESLNLNNI